MGRRFGSRGTVTAEPENEYVTGAEPHPSEGNPEHGIPPYPEPLPGIHHYPEPEPVHDETLTVGPAKPYYSGGNAHGVRSPVRHGGRPAPRPEHRDAFRTEDEAITPEGRVRAEPIPVFIVNPSSGAKSISKASLRNVTVTMGADPVRIVERDDSRIEVRLLNETTGAPVRMMEGPYGQVGKAVGSLLPAAMSSYLHLPTEDEIWAVSDSTATANAVISIICTYKIAR